MSARRKRLNKSVRPRMEALEKLGWRDAGQAKNGHIMIVHESGAKMQIAYSPRDPWRTLKNELARAKRLTEGNSK